LDRCRALKFSIDIFEELNSQILCSGAQKYHSGLLKTDQLPHFGHWYIFSPSRTLRYIHEDGDLFRDG